MPAEYHRVSFTNEYARHVGAWPGEVDEDAAPGGIFEENYFVHGQIILNSNTLGDYIRVLAVGDAVASVQSATEAQVKAARTANLANDLEHSLGIQGDLAETCEFILSQLRLLTAASNDPAMIKSQQEFGRKFDRATASTEIVRALAANPGSLADASVQLDDEETAVSMIHRAYINPLLDYIGAEADARAANSAANVRERIRHSSFESERKVWTTQIIPHADFIADSGFRLTHAYKHNHHWSQESLRLLRVKIMAKITAARS